MSALWEGGAQLTMKMTTAFNRLVKNTGNVKTVSVHILEYYFILVNGQRLMSVDTV